MPTILSFADTLWLRIGPALRASSLGTKMDADMTHHREMLRALRIADPRGLTRALEDDVYDGVELIQSYLESMRDKK
jgi:hypothetical protein